MRPGGAPPESSDGLEAEISTPSPGALTPRFPGAIAVLAWVLGTFALLAVAGCAAAPLVPPVSAHPILVCTFHKASDDGTPYLICQAWTR